jgi:hypothetical protein
LTNLTRIHGRDWGLAGLLVLLAFSAYCPLGLSLSAKGAFAGYDHVFDADPNRAIEDLAGGGCTFEVATARHPLFVVFFAPWGALLNHVTGSKVVSAVLMNAMFGGLLVGLFYVFLRVLELGSALAMGFTVILAASASSLVFGSVPDTFVFSAFALLLLFTIDAWTPNEKRFLLAFVPASIFAVGITSLNVVACFIIVALRYRSYLGQRRNELKPFVIRGLAAAGSAIVAFAALLLVQKVIYPSTFAPSTDSDLRNLIEENVSVPFADGSVGVLEKTLPFYFRDNVISPGLSAEFQGTDPVPFVWPYNYTVDAFESAGRIAQYNIRFVTRTCYALLIGTWLYLLIKTPAHGDKTLLALSAYFLFTALFHLFYGSSQVYVYSAHYTFAWIALLAIPMKNVAELPQSGRRFAYAALAGFLTFLLVNNAVFAYKLVTVFP